MGYNAKGFFFVASAAAVGAVVIAPIVRQVVPSDLLNMNG